MRLTQPAWSASEQGAETTRRTWCSPQRCQAGAWKANPRFRKALAGECASLRDVIGGSLAPPRPRLSARSLRADGRARSPRGRTKTNTLIVTTTGRGVTAGGLPGNRA
jgi:hypothetical protein